MDHNRHARQYQGPMNLDPSPPDADSTWVTMDGGRMQFDQTQLGFFPAVDRSGNCMPATTAAPFGTAVVQQAQLHQQRQQHQHQQHYHQQHGRRPAALLTENSSSSSREAPRPRKVPIPKVSTESLQPRRRSARACEPCRQRKIKCDGNKPTCKQCVEHEVTCVFLDVKRVRDQKQMALLSKQVGRYEGILKDLVSEVDCDTAGRIRDALKKRKRLPVSSSGTPNDDNEESDSSASSASVASLNEIDLIQEDVNLSERSRAAGFFGKSSEVCWMQRLEGAAERRSRSTDSISNPASSISELTPTQTSPNDRFDVPLNLMNYHLDDLNIPIYERVDPQAVPPRPFADKFLQAYLDSVHPSFCAIRKSIFVNQYEQFFRQPSSKPNRRWLAILNMIFAIGCRYCRLIERCTGEYYNDQVYLNRARLLSLNGNVLFDHPDLQQVQVEFLVAFYLLSSGQVNRASKISSMALRSALSLGLNLRLVDSQTHYASKEARCRLWWCIFELEHLLTAITGRVSGVGENLSSVPAPLPVEEEQFEQPDVQLLINDPSLRESCLKMTLLESDGEGRTTAEWLAACEPKPSLYFYLLVDLSMITQGIINRIYSIEGLRSHKGTVERRIQHFARKLDNWLAKVPPTYRFVDNDGQLLDISCLTASSQPHTRERISLAMAYYSARITMCRPCLSSSQGRQQRPSRDPQQRQAAAGGQEPRRGSESAAPPPPPPSSPPLPPLLPQSRFGAEKSYACMRAACSLIYMLPDSNPGQYSDNQDAIWLTTVSPWWCVLHYIMQATTVLLLGISAWQSPKSAVAASSSSASASAASLLHNSGTTTTTTSSSVPDGSLSSSDVNNNNNYYYNSATTTPPIDLPILLAHALKALRCLRNMAGTSVASERAYKLCASFMRRIAPTLDMGVDVDVNVDWESVMAMDLPGFENANRDGRGNHPDAGGNGGGGGGGGMDTSLRSELEAMDDAFQQRLRTEGFT